jgi:hypothetical protein
MVKALMDQFTPSYNPQPRKRTCKTPDADYKPANIDIGIISTARFVLNCQDPGSTLFAITLEEIDYEIQDRQVSNQYIEATNLELVACKLPVVY